MRKALAILLVFSFYFLPSKAQELIGCREGDSWAETPMLRKTFTVPAGDLEHYDFQTLQFSVDVTSLGYHEVYVNNTLVGDHVMQPAVSQLDKRALKVTYDIKPYIQEGDNEIMLWLGQGWGRIYGTPAVAKAEVTRCVSDGDCGLLYILAQTDSTWEASPSGYSYTDNWQPMHFGGERYDSRVQPEWRPASVYNASDIKVSEQQFEGNYIVDTLLPISGMPQPDSSLLLDFGRVATGWFQATFPPMPEGHEITMEYLDHVDAKPLFTETDIYISSGDSGHFTNRFHMHAFRYVRLRGLNSQFSILNSQLIQISAVDPKEGATFECSDPRLNAIHDMVKYTLSCLTFSGYLVDCPHIERMGYGGDGNSSTMTLQTLWDVRDTYNNWMQAWSDAIDSTGDLPYVAPSFRTGGGPYWSGFIIKAPWRTHLNYGDRSLIYEHYDKMVRWLDFVEQHCEDGILKPWTDTDRRAWFLGDWAVPEGVDKGGESVLHVSNCFLAECLSDMVQMARMTGHPDDAKRFSAWRKSLVSAIHRHFYHPETHTYANGTVLDQCYALLQSIPSDSSTAQTVREQLLTDIHGRYRDHIAVGLVGVPVFTEWCIRERQADLMATLLRQPDYPGYLYMINSEFRNSNFENWCDSNSKFSLQHSKLKIENQTGAAANSQSSTLNSQFATTWESWDCGRPGKEDRSRVHNCYNGIGIWFYQALAGIRPDPEHPGYGHFFIDPQPVAGIDWVKVTQPTPCGDIQVEIKSGKLKVEIPDGTSATLFPNTSKERTVKAGKWEFDMQ